MKLNNKLVMIRVDKAKSKSDEGFFIQDEWVNRLPIGVVEAVSEDVRFCSVGDRVLFERYTSIEDPEDDAVRYCREDAVLGVYDKTSN